MASHKAAKRKGAALQVSIGYAIVGFLNVLLPCIIFVCAYLIIPFSRGSVVLIECLPAIAAKILFPHLIHFVPYTHRVLLVVIFWTICGFVSYATPPNIEAPLRVLIVMLATATAAVTDVWMLGMLRYYGRPGLIGWGVGTGLGSLAAAVYPYIVTVKMGIFLRDNLESLFLLVPALGWGLALVITTHSLHKLVKAYQEEDRDTDDGLSLLTNEPPRPARTFRAGVEHNIHKLGGLVKPFMTPLYSALVAQALSYPGFNRASPVSDSYANFFSFITSCGFAFHIGNLVGRSSLLYKRMESRNMISRCLTVCIAITILNALFAFFSAPMLVLGLALITGISSGTVYIQTLDATLEMTLRDMPSDCEFLMGAVSVADSIGLVFGGLIGSVFEDIICQDAWEGADRWCFPR